MSEKEEEMTGREIARFIALQAKEGKTLIDLGSSLGRSFELFADSGYTVLSYEISEPMLDIQNELFGQYKNVSINKCDIVNDYPNISADIVLSILTIQFTPIEHRQKLLSNIYRSLNSGGVFILVEKVLGSTSDIDELLVKTYYEGKKQNGYTDKQIAEKRKSLEGVLVPVTSDFNVQLLKSAGFSEVDCF